MSSQIPKFEQKLTLESLFVGYVLMQVPSNMLITKVKPGMYMSSWMLVWAAVSGKLPSSSSESVS
jgi:hypothetical protein